MSVAYHAAPAPPTAPDRLDVSTGATLPTGRAGAGAKLERLCCCWPLPAVAVGDARLDGSECESGSESSRNLRMWLTGRAG